MEMATAPNTMVLTLTYNDDTPENRDAARTFAYCDVSAFFKRVRAALFYAYPGEDTWLRFLVAGEQGDRNSRCHWHCVVYSSHELPTVGTFNGFMPGVYGKVELTWPDDQAAMLTTGKGRHERRLDWTLWGKGFLTLQEASQAAMAYVLSYVLKDQFTAEKSRDTRRFSKAENFATGLFRMSKRPAIGERFLFQRLGEMAEMGQCPPSVALKVPGFKGYYSPSGRMREQFLWGLVAIKHRVMFDTGGVPPQWRTLLASVVENEKDIEVLHGSQENPDDDESIESEIAKRERAFAFRQKSKGWRRRCGGELPCLECLRGFDSEQLASCGVEKYTSFDPEGEAIETFRSLEGFEAFEGRKRRFVGRCNSLCVFRGSKALREAFPSSGDA